MKKTIADRLLDGVASITELVSDGAPFDPCWCWTYKPKMPASMQQELKDQMALEVK